MLRVNNNQFSPNLPKTSDVKSSQATKDAFLGRMERTARAEKKSINDDSLISHDELVSIASSLKDGSISPSEASDRFVDQVVNNSVGKKLSTSDVQSIATRIGEFFGQDREFQQDLEKNLRRLV